MNCLASSAALSDTWAGASSGPSPCLGEIRGSSQHLGWAPFLLAELLGSKTVHLSAVVGPQFYTYIYICIFSICTHTNPKRSEIATSAAKLLTTFSWGFEAISGLHLGHKNRSCYLDKLVSGLGSKARCLLQVCLDGERLPTSTWNRNQVRAVEGSRNEPPKDLGKASHMSGTVRLKAGA